MTEEDRISQQLVQQRVRNRIIEYLELVASAEDQRDYERRAPTVSVPNEIINQWEDWIDTKNWAWYAEPVFSAEETNAIRSFHVVWLAVAEDTPNPIPGTVDALIETSVWRRLMIAAGEAYQTFSVRGRLDEERECQF